MLEDQALPAQRLDSIDALRAAAILLMVQIHFVQNLARDTLEGGTRLYYASHALGMIPAPLFTFLAGMSLRLSLARGSRGGDGRESALRHARRGILIVFFGLVFATLVRMPDQVFAWDILPFIGAALLVLLALRRRSAGTLLLAAVLVVALGPLLRSLSDYEAHWPDGHRYRYAFTLAEVAWGFVANGYFPLFPWLVFPLAGFLVGGLLLSDEPRSRALRAALPAVGLTFLVLSLAGAAASERLTGIWRWYASPSRFYPATTTFILKALGAILCAFWFLHRRLDGGTGRRRPLPSFLRLYSRFSLTTYVVHHAVHLWPLLLAAQLRGQTDPWHYYAAAMPTGTALALAGLFVLLFSPVLAAWDRRGGRFSFEWLLSRLAGEPTP